MRGRRRSIQTAEHLSTRERKWGEGMESESPPPPQKKRRKRKRRGGWWPVYAVTELPEASG